MDILSGAKLPFPQANKGRDQLNKFYCWPDGEIYASVMLHGFVVDAPNTPSRANCMDGIGNNT